MRACGFCDEALTQPGPERGRVCRVAASRRERVVTQPRQREGVSRPSRTDSAETEPKCRPKPPWPSATTSWIAQPRAAVAFLDRSFRAGERGPGPGKRGSGAAERDLAAATAAHSFGLIWPDRLTVWSLRTAPSGSTSWHGPECILRAVVVRRLLTEAGYPATAGNSDRRAHLAGELRSLVPAGKVAEVIETFIW